jgi:hypothetical protein
MSEETYERRLSDAVLRSDVLAEIVLLILGEMRRKKMQIRPATRQKIATMISHRGGAQNDRFFQEVSLLIAETPMEREDKRETPRKSN